MKAFAEIGVCQIKLHVVGIRIGAQSRLKMLDSLIVQAIAGEQYADPRLGAVIVAAELVKLSVGPASIFRFAKFQVGFGEQVEILRLVRVFLDLFGELGQVELRALARRESCAIVEIIEKVLVGIGAGRGVFGQGLKDVQVALCGLGLVQAARDHGELVVAGSGIAAYLYVAAKELGGLFEFFVGNAQVC